MKDSDLRDLLAKFKAGSIPVDSLLDLFKRLPFDSVANLPFASLDLHRELRQGFPEVVYAAGKSKEQLLSILLTLFQRSHSNLLATRASPEQFDFVSSSLPDAKFDEVSRIIYVDRDSSLVRDPNRSILILTAGTSDIPVAEEARLTAFLFGNHVKTCYDCGVAGIHRLFSHLDDIFSSNVIIVVAGMDGALASVVGGLVDRPVIAVPTSVGYGASFHGLSSLLAMLNSCAAGVSVVNIDNGFGAAVAASKFNLLR